MKVIIPNYIQYNVQNYTLPFITREADEDFFKTVGDANQYILDNYCNESYESYNKQKDLYTEKTYTYSQMINQIKKTIEYIFNNKVLPCLITDYQKYTNYKSLFKFMSDDTSKKYESELNELKLVHKLNLQQRNEFIRDNKDEIIQNLYLIKQEYILKKRRMKSIINQKYYQSRKIIMDIEPKPLLTEEQKNINLKLSKHNYYLKNKNKVKKPITNNAIEKNLTSMQIKRQDCNRRYYSKKMNRSNPVFPV
jgi:hypothetical protein